MKPPSSIALRKSTRILFFCALAALLWLAGYGYKRGFTRSWREAVFAEFRKHGIEVTFKKLTLDPFRGLVAREAVLYETSNRSRVLAEIDQAVLSVDLGRLARKRNFLTALELRDARLSLPIDPSNPSAPPLQIEHLRAHLFFPDQQVRVQQAEALVLGCRLSAQGWLTHPPTLQPAQPNAPRSAWQTWAQLLAKELSTLKKNGSTSPRAQLQFRGDLSDPQSILVSLRISADEINLRGYPLDSVELAAVWRNESLELQELALEDSRGKLRATGHWDSKNLSAALQIESTLDPVGIAHALSLSHWTRGLVFLQRPSIRIQFEKTPPPESPPTLLGSIESGPFSLHETRFQSVSAHFSHAPNHWSLRDATLAHASGSLVANLLHTPDQFRAKITSTLPPDVLLVPLPDALKASAPIPRSSHPAHIEIEIAGPAPDPLRCAAWGLLKLGPARIHDVPIEGFDSPILLQNGQAIAGPFKLVRNEGTASGTLSLDLPSGRTFLHGIDIQLHLGDLLRLLLAENAPSLAPFQFAKTSPPLLHLEGSIQTTQPAQPAQPAKDPVSPPPSLAFLLEAPTGASVDFAGKPVPLQNLRASLTLTPSQFSIDTLHAQLLGGSAQLHARLPLHASPPLLSGSLQLHALRFAELTRLYQPASRAKGSLSASLDWSIAPSDSPQVRASGTASLSQTHAAEWPGFAPLFQLLPAPLQTSSEPRHHASLQWELRDNTLLAFPLQIDAAPFALRLEGSLHLKDLSLQLQAKLSSSPPHVPGTEAPREADSMRFKARGSLLKPLWQKD